MKTPVGKEQSEDPHRKWSPSEAG